MNLKAETIKKIENSINKAILPEKMPIKRGNLKISKDTLIFSMSTAYHCPAAKKGLCKVRNICYGLKGEATYNRDTPKYHEKQHLYWKLRDAEDIFNDILDIVRNERIKTRYIRFNEVGDIEDTEDLEKLKKLAKLLENAYITQDIIIYGYTARYDMKKEIMTNKPKNLIINGSGFMLDNRFNAVDEIDDYIPETVCPGKCLNCKLCKEIKGMHIYIKKH